jgi:TPR repeat protein
MLAISTAALKGNSSAKAILTVMYIIALLGLTTVGLLSDVRQIISLVIPATLARKDIQDKEVSRNKRKALFYFYLGCSAFNPGRCAR